jgi:WRKY DNA -binding domain
MLCFN